MYQELGESIADLIALFVLKGLHDLVTGVVSCDGIKGSFRDRSDLTIHLLSVSRIHCRIEKQK